MLGSEARTATGTGPAFDVPHQHRAVEVVLDVTAGQTEAGDTLDVFVQAFVNGAWIDVIHFTQVVGNAADKTFVAKICGDEPQAMFETGSALAAGSVRHLLSGRYRVRWDIVDVATTGNVSFTFSVAASYIHNWN